MTTNVQMAVILPKEDYDKLKIACKLRGEPMGVFGRRAIYIEMTKMGLRPPEGRAVLGVG